MPAHKVEGTSNANYLVKYPSVLFPIVQEYSETFKWNYKIVVNITLDVCANTCYKKGKLFDK